MDGKIKMLIMDVDGTMTDGKVYYGESGEEMKAFSIKDGLGIVKMQKYGIVPVIITGRKSSIVARRAQDLSIQEVYQGVADKAALAEDIFRKYDITGSRAAYIGDDENDIGIMKKCGLIGCPSDAAEEVKKISGFIAPSRGGEGAVRDFIEWILKRQEGENEAGYLCENEKLEY